MSAVDFTAHKHPVLAVDCPWCKARVGTWCKRPSGHKAMFSAHVGRKHEADRVWEAGHYPPIVRTRKGWAYGEARSP